MFRLNRVLSLLVLTGGMLVMTACGDSSSGEEESASDEYEVTLTYSDHDPPGAMRTKFVEEVWIPEIEKQTDSQVTVNTEFGGSLLSSQEALDGTADGIADMTMIFPDFYPEKLFGFQMFKLFPEAPKDFESLSNIFQRSLEEIPILNEELEEANQKPLLITLGLPAAFGASYEMDGLEDIAGEDWRASSRWHLKSLEYNDANPVSVPWEDVYTSLETGVMDGVMTNYDGFHQMQFYEVAQEVTVARELWWGSPFIHTINLDTWEDMPEGIQEDIMTATDNAQEEFAKVYAEELEQTVEEEREEGVNVEYASEEDVELFTNDELLNNMRKTWVEEAQSEHGMKDAEAYIDNLREIMDESME